MSAMKSAMDRLKLKKGIDVQKLFGPEEGSPEHEAQETPNEESAEKKILIAIGLGGSDEGEAKHEDKEESEESKENALSIKLGLAPDVEDKEKTESDLSGATKNAPKKKGLPEQLKAGDPMQEQFKSEMLKGYNSPKGKKSLSLGERVREGMKK